ncbi:MAG: polysulfide reductase NrfD [Chloroflexi bacterium]|nr:polysulfide reductase NrfD [Chloroflexota bacterium]
MDDEYGFGKHAALIKPLETTRSWEFVLTVVILTAAIIFGAGAYGYQLIRGVGVTGLNRPISWGLYIVNCIYFIALSYGALLTSAILRLTNAKWRLPITRAAEGIMVCTLGVGATNIVLDMGRPDRALTIPLFAQFRSPIVWDFVWVSLYLISSWIYLYLTLIPDIALLRDRYPHRKRLYRFLALGYTGTPKQKRLIRLAVNGMTIAMIPIAVTVCTVLAWLFALTVQPMWHSTLMGPYFVIGAVFSGIGILIFTLAILRRLFHLENYIKYEQFRNLGYLLLVVSLVWSYFTVADYITTLYGNEPAHMAVFDAKISGEFALQFWAQVVFCFVVPFVIVVIPRFRTITGLTIAGLSANAGMWLERVLIIVPTLARPRMPIGAGYYMPTWVEWSVMLACIAAIGLFYVIFVKFFPIISIWELEEAEAKDQQAAEERCLEIEGAESSPVEAV